MCCNECAGDSAGFWDQTTPAPAAPPVPVDNDPEWKDALVWVGFGFLLAMILLVHKGPA